MLQNERDEACERAILARENLQKGQPPSETADAEFQKMLQAPQERLSFAKLHLNSLFDFFSEFCESMRV